MRPMEGRLTKQSKFQKSNADWALFLDFDGTLVDIAPSPESVHVPRELPTLLGHLDAALGGALAIVTGRSIEAIDAYLAPLRPITAGVHGAELRLGREQIISTALPLPPAAVEAISALSNKVDGVRIEIKRSSLAVHFRSNPAAGPEIEEELRRVLIDGASGFIIRPGRMVYELLPSHVSKGGAIDALLELPLFFGRRPIVIGDDLSDETAFAAAQRRGGLAFTVAGEHFSRDNADFESPLEVRSWLGAFAARFGSHD
jgi:trehalose 6-phosphate phosphatase